jgi:hypothetical protein
MITDHSKSVIQKAKQIYEPMQERLELQESGKFVAIEPESGDYFLADSFDEAVKAARTAHPGRVSHTIKIGSAAAFQIGLMVTNESAFGLIGTGLLAGRKLTVDYAEKTVIIE